MNGKRYSIELLAAYIVNSTATDSYRIPRIKLQLLLFYSVVALFIEHGEIVYL